MNVNAAPAEQNRKGTETPQLEVPQTFGDVAQAALRIGALRARANHQEFVIGSAAAEVFVAEEAGRCKWRWPALYLRCEAPGRRSR